MSEPLSIALEAALAAGAEHAEARWLSTTHERLAARRGQLAGAGRSEESGLSVRVLAGGAWGFAATRSIDPDSLAAAAREAVAAGRACARLRARPLELADEPVHVATWETPFELDPASISTADKGALLVECSRRLEEQPGIRLGDASMMFRTERQQFANSRGSRIDQTLRFACCGMSATSVGPGGVQKRSYPASWGQCVGGGYELVRDLDLPAHVVEIAAEAAALQEADLCPEGTFDLILDPRQLTLQIHESVGHPLELDRVLGGEANFAGTSFATTEKLGNLRYGSEHVSITADATLPGGLATFGYDDEGVAAQKWPLIKEGLLTGYLTSREYAAAIGERRSRGTLRSDSWYHPPIVRMVNIGLEPGPEDLDLEDLIADTKHGLFMSTNRSWSIDQRRVNFQFGCELAWEIRDGKRHRLLRNPLYNDLTTRFWGSCDVVGGARSWEPWGVFNCGKGQPMQIAEMTHGSSPARFRGVPCGSGK